MVIEDDGAIQDLFRQILSDEGYELTFVERLEHAPADAAPDLVIADLVGLDRYDGAHARASVRRVQERFPAVSIIVCTAYQEAHEEADRLGAATVLEKPFTIGALIEVVDTLIDR